MVDTKAITEEVTQAILAGDWDKAKSFATEDATAVDPEGVASGFKEYWMGFAEMLGKYSWISEYHLVTDTKVIGRCYDYVESKDGSKSTMFRADFIVTFNKDGKIEKWEGFMDAEQKANFAKVF